MDNNKILSRNGRALTTPTTLHPGSVLADELAARALKKAEFAQLLGMKASHFSELLHGKRHISAAMALKLEEKLGIEAEFWLRVQVAFDLAEARSKRQMLAA